MLISVEAYSERTKLVSWPSHALLPELRVRASALLKRAWKGQKLIKKKTNSEYKLCLKPD